MHKLLNIPFLILTFSLVIGIVFGHNISINLNLIIILQIIAIIGLASCWWYAKKIFHSATGFTILVFINFTFSGIILVNIHSPEHNQNHYIHFLDEFRTDQVSISFQIKERLKPTTYYEKYIVEIQSIENKKIVGNLLLQLPKSSITVPLITGESFICLSQIKPIPGPLNPHQFDYASYLAQQYVFHKITTNFNKLISTNYSVFSIYRFAALVRTNINLKLNNYSFNKKQLSIINALLLGQRQDIDNETLTDYKNAGAIHILAVSGLHVGILLMLLQIILKPLDRFSKNGKIIKTFLVIILLWCFAVIAGLSPSVLRAVTMFSFIAIGLHIRSKTSIYNALIVSIFILLCIRPLLLFSVGFQLSYIAVFSIVWIQPSFVKLYKPRFYADKILWETFTVTIAAQLGLFPLTLFYFHQFPLLFFVANLIIIPFLGFILGFGILVIILSLIQILPNWLATTFGKCIDAINLTVHLVGKQEDFLLTEIPFSWRMLILGYFFIISLILFLKKRSYTRTLLIAISINCFLLLMNYEKYMCNKKEELVIFHNQRETIIGTLQPEKLRIYSNDSITEKNKEFILQGYITENNAQLKPQKKLKNVYRYKSKTILIIDSAGIYNLEGLQVDMIVLSNSPKIHLNRMITILKPKQIIADGSNYKSYLDQWEITCKKQNLPFHRTDKKGAYIYK
ncbi:ComEC/Rec2 family competence protein [Aquimarina sp. SS2-1]|uniref:ComEC/Rec2 family competence protein n=1 Tax=Aquimarina besae TaxID=3342247 RepID=UPI00366EE3EB